MSGVEGKSGVYKKTKEHIRKLVLSRKNHSEEWKKKYGEKVRANNLRLGLKPPSQLGVKRTNATKKKISGYLKKHPIKYWLGKKRIDMTGNRHFFWKGDDVLYGALHSWVIRKLGKAIKCNNKDCKYPRLNSRGKVMMEAKVFHWANISGLYKRNIKDWISLCVKCHSDYDNKKINI